MERWEVEEIVLGMADIVLENRRLRRKLEEAEGYKKKYHDAVDALAKQAAESQKSILEAILAGAFNTKREDE